ncbi:MAG: methyltransferase domain-containing protein [Thiohalorhabdaceae bacterium]
MASSSEPWPEPAQVPFDKAAVRRDFARAATTYDRHAALQRQVAARVANLYGERAHPEGSTILDLGSGTGLVGRALNERDLIPERLVALDLAHAMTRSGRRGQQPAITADAESLPLAPNSLDAVVSSLTLQWLNRLPAALGEAARCLRPGGVLVASTLAAGTLTELEAALRTVDGHGGVGPFLGREAMAGALVASGLAESGCWVETETLTASRPRAVLRDLKGLGAVDKTPERARGLHGRDRLARLERAYRDACGVAEGPVPVTWRVAYLVAWKPR